MNKKKGNQNDVAEDVFWHAPGNIGKRILIEVWEGITVGDDVKVKTII